MNFLYHLTSLILLEDKLKSQYFNYMARFICYICGVGQNYKQKRQKAN